MQLINDAADGVVGVDRPLADPSVSEKCDDSILIYSSPTMIRPPNGRVNTYNAIGGNLDELAS